MQYEHITSEQQLRDFCAQIAAAEIIAFDTEFVSEDSYLPELCLVQVAAGGKLAVIDPYEVPDLNPFWDLLVNPGRETLVHAGREEFRFCLRQAGKRPHRWFDVQMAAGLIGMEYPASYGTLVGKLLGKSLGKEETRTDWRKRPLSTRQLQYAMQDVADLEALREVLGAKLERLGRTEWLQTELALWQDDIETFEKTERWQRVSGISNLSGRGLAIVRELWRWRDSEAERRNFPTKRVLRDDLIVELAKRQSADPKRITAIRGLERGDIQRQMTRITDAIQRALDLPENELPRLERHPSRPQLNLLGQFLSTALGSICRSASVSASLVGTSQDVRDLIAFRLGMWSPHEEPPILARGWRAEVVGQVIEHLLDGDLAIAITDPLADEPLSFEPRVRNSEPPA